jgi:cell division protein ZapA
VSADAARDKGALTINLLGREFRVGCPEGEERELLATVDYINKKLKEVRDVGKVVGNERIALMTALNVAHELLAQQKASPATATTTGGNGVDTSAFRRRIVAMQETVDSALVADQENLF